MHQTDQQWRQKWIIPQFTFKTDHLYKQVRLEWPTDLAINPMDNSIYVLDNNVVLQITENGQVQNDDAVWSNVDSTFESFQL